MILNPAFISIASVTLVLISLATFIGYILLRNNPNNETFKKVMVIIKSWWLIIGFILICLGFAPLGLLVGFGILSILGVIEFEKHTRVVEIKKHAIILTVTSVILQYLCLYYSLWSGFFAIPILFIYLGSAFIVIRAAKIEKVPEIFSHYAVLILTFHLLAYIPALYIFNLQKSTAEHSLYLMFFLILLTELNDILQFICGKAFGRTKVFPLISPNKTGAGFIGGIIGITLLGGALFHTFAGFTLVKSCGLGLIISISGIMGDLSFSAIKRYLATKDFSNLLPGHGGVLDRLDSLIFTTPCVFYFLYFT
ncbi:MAG: phosphatidate cytidylyltransferase [Bdellovibrionales bacterium]|nr:phosphatidate cytidylyltransferase [Bdellovibrionales bacterium]